MHVENHVARRIRRSGILAQVSPRIASHLRRMTVIMIAVGVRMDTSSRHACRHHRNHQQQPGQLPDGTLDPEVHAAAECSKYHLSRMPDKT